jgi:hypothetical protein
MRAVICHLRLIASYVLSIISKKKSKLCRRALSPYVDDRKFEAQCMSPLVEGISSLSEVVVVGSAGKLRGV